MSFVLSQTDPREERVIHFSQTVTVCASRECECRGKVRKRLRFERAHLARYAAAARASAASIARRSASVLADVVMRKTSAPPPAGSSVADMRAFT